VAACGPRPLLAGHAWLRPHLKSSSARLSLSLPLPSSCMYSSRAALCGVASAARAARGAAAAAGSASAAARPASSAPRRPATGRGCGCCGSGCSGRCCWACWRAAAVRAAAAAAAAGPAARLLPPAVAERPSGVLQRVCDGNALISAAAGCDSPVADLSHSDTSIN
jgi:hypothetical protein